MLLAGVSELAGSYRIIRNRTDFHLVLATLDGSGQLHDGRSLQRGSVLLAPAGSRYAYQIQDPSWTIVWFHGATSQPWGQGVQVQLQQADPMLLDQLTTACRAGITASQHPDPHLADELCRAHCALAFRLLDLLLDSREPTPCDHLASLWPQVEADLARPWQIADLCRLCHLSASQLQRQHRQRYGCSVRQYLIRLRMERARLLVRRFDYPLDSVAQQVGYANGFALSGAFKRYWGQSPSILRHEHTTSAVSHK